MEMNPLHTVPPDDSDFWTHMSNFVEREVLANFEVSDVIGYKQFTALVNRVEALEGKAKDTNQALIIAAEQALEILESDNITTVDGEFCRWCDGRLNASHDCFLEQTIRKLRSEIERLKR